MKIIMINILYILTFFNIIELISNIFMIQLQESQITAQTSGLRQLTDLIRETDITDTLSTANITRVSQLVILTPDDLLAMDLDIYQLNTIRIYLNDIGFRLKGDCVSANDLTGIDDRARLALLDTDINFLVGLKLTVLRQRLFDILRCPKPVIRLISDDVKKALDKAGLCPRDQDDPKRTIPQTQRAQYRAPHDPGKKLNSCFEVQGRLINEETLFDYCKAISSNKYLIVNTDQDTLEIPIIEVARDFGVQSRVVNDSIARNGNGKIICVKDNETDLKKAKVVINLKELRQQQE